MPTLAFHNDYLEVLQERFNVAAVLTHDSRLIQLGDYGYYIDGTFVWRGNLFSHIECKGEKIYRIESGPEDPTFLYSTHARGPLPQRWVSEDGDLFTKVLMAFPQEPGFFLHLQELRSELFFLNDEIEKQIQQLVDSGEWDEEYRLVWQRYVSDNTRFGYTLQGGGSVQLMADEGAIFSGFQDTDLKPSLFGCRNVNLDAWFRPYRFTPAVNLTRVRTEEDLCMGSVEGFWQEELEAMGASSLVLDNGYSVL